METVFSKHVGAVDTLITIEPPITGDQLGPALEIINGNKYSDGGEGLVWFTVDHSPDSQATINEIVRALEELKAPN